MEALHSSSRQLGLMPALAIVTGESIAIGIFLTPASMARSLGSPLLLALVWGGMVLMAFCGALCFSDLAVRFPQSGGEYVYLRAGFGDTVAFLYGWMGTFVMYPGVAAALAVGSQAYVAQVLPLPASALALEPALAICLFCGLNLLGTRLTGAVASVTTALKIALILGTALWALGSGHAHLSNLLPFATRRPGADPLIAAIAGAAVSAFFSLGGWWEAGKIAGEMRNPRRDLPIAFLGGVTFVGLIYLLVSEIFLAVVPLDRVSSNTAFVAQFGAELFGPAGARLLSVCVLVCVFSGLAALSMASPRVVFAMACNGQFFPAFGRLHARLGTPANAILLESALALAVLGLGAFDRVLAFIIFSAVLFLALTVYTLFRLPHPPRVWWFPWAPVAFIGFCILLDLLLLVRSPLPALAGVVLVFCGLPLRRLFAPANELISQRSES
jgi:APA family basic amino acid/polyamine antiporter